MADIDTGTNDLLASLDEGVLTLTLNRPEARNAMSGAMTAARGWGFHDARTPELPDRSNSEASAGAIPAA